MSSPPIEPRGSAREREIVAARVIVTCPGRNFVTLRIETRSGVHGLGDATLNGRELAVAAYLERHIVPNLIGRDAGRIEDTWQFLYRGAYWRRGPVTMTAIAAVDVALWDILGKLAGLPLYRLLGGRSRDGVLAYGHASGRDIEEASADVGRYLALGYRAVRAQCGIPGLKKPYGIPGSAGGASPGAGPASGAGPTSDAGATPGSGAGAAADAGLGARAGQGSGGGAGAHAGAATSYEPAESSLPAETVWSSARYLEIVPRLFERLRADHGSDVELLHDVHHRLTPVEAARLARDLQPYRLFFLEDATPAEDQEAFALIRQHSVTPLAVGEVFNSIWDCKHLIEARLIDYIRTTLVHAGGITHVRRLADFAALHQVRTGFHGATDLSPVCMGAALHFDTWVPSFGIQEYMPHSAETLEVFPRDYTFRDGYLHCGESPGHGVDLDERAAARFPYSPKQLPIARLPDGSMWDW